MKKFVLAFIVILFIFTEFAAAAPTTAQQAEKTVRGWLKNDPAPLGMQLGGQIKNIQVFTDTNGEPIYYIVYLKPSGFVIVSADDLLEPIVGFAGKGKYDPSPQNPLGALTDSDLKGQVHAARQFAKGQTKENKQKYDAKFAKSRAKWDQLAASTDSLSEGLLLESGVSDIRVEPLVQSQWSQDVVCNYNCYNLYTPSQYPAGCVATAAAQLMRYYQYPAAPSDLGPFTIQVNSNPQDATLRGGDGHGGQYDWANMVLVPDCNTTAQQQSAIGSLCHDVGVAANLSYAKDGTSGDIGDAAKALLQVFAYSNVRIGYSADSLIPNSKLIVMLNSNLDAGYPCLLAIYSTAGGHAVVCDGYGYNAMTPYHHLNMGWSGASDAYYHLPDINDTDTGNYSLVYRCLYNVYTSGSGEIISGRVTDASGNAVTGASITATSTAGGSYTAATNDRGIFALSKIPSNSTYTITAVKDGNSFGIRTVQTGTSKTNSSQVGNVWGVNFGNPRFLTAKKFAVKAGKLRTGSLDSFSITGTFDVTDRDIADSNTIGLRLSNTAEQILQASIPFDSAKVKKSKYSYKRPKGDTGIIRSASFDLKRGTFSIAADKINLTGLRCPVNVELEWGAYAGQCQADEDIVNAKKPIPMQLLAGYANALRIDKASVRANKKDSTSLLTIKGAIAAQAGDVDLTAVDLTLHWDGKDFALPIGSFSWMDHGKYVWTNPQGQAGSITQASFDFEKCTFQASIKNAATTAKTPMVTCGITFGSFDQEDDYMLHR